MAKLHELLAVEGQLKGQAQATRTELRGSFEKKRHLFEEKVLTYVSNEEGADRSPNSNPTFKARSPKS